jgi:ApbE superfamily uncharacterized protein (UPF0280 family)
VPPGPQARLLSGGRRLHLQHGPVDVVIEAWGEPAEVGAAYRQATAAFAGLLDQLVAELPLLRQPVRAGHRPEPAGLVARRMVNAVWPHRRTFVTPMAAVAGAVADHLLAAAVAGRELSRAYANDGGDIALHLAPGTSLTFGMVADVEHPRLDGTLVVRAADPVRGVATSGRGGRSLSLGMADAVTVLARDAAAADAAATLVANAVDLAGHPSVERLPAEEIDPDSDLGDLPVTVSVGDLSLAEVTAALAAGAAEAERMRAGGLIEAAGLWLRGTFLAAGPLPGLAGGGTSAPD